MEVDFADQKLVDFVDARSHFTKGIQTLHDYLHKMHLVHHLLLHRRKATVDQENLDSGTDCPEVEMKRYCSSFEILLLHPLLADCSNVKMRVLHQILY